MACRLYGTNPLPEPMVDYIQLNSYEQKLVEFDSK